MIEAVVFFICALLTGLGIGSAGILIVYLTSAVGLSQLSAQAANLAFFIIAAASATVLNIKNGLILKKELFILSLAGAVGAVGGTVLASAIDEGLLKKLFGGLLILMGIFIFFGKSKK